MERLIQLLDDLDDLISTIGLISERVRNAWLSLLFTCVALAAQVGAVLLALSHPPLALATAILLFVTLLYRQVTRPQPAFAQVLS
jgi:Mg2+/Co2+ transporter CorB